MKIKTAEQIYREKFPKSKDDTPFQKLSKENLKKMTIEAMEDYLTEFVNHHEFDKHKLFGYMRDEYNIMLMDSEMNDIREIVLPHKYPYAV